MKKYIFLLLIIILIIGCDMNNFNKNESEEYLLTYEMADSRAAVLMSKLNLDQKIEIIGGYSRFFIKGFPELGMPYIFSICIKNERGTLVESFS